MSDKTTPRINRSRPLEKGYSLFVRFDGDKDDREIDLTGWVAKLGPALQALRDPTVWQTAAVSEFRDAIYWGGDEDGDLAIDAVHLKMIHDFQSPMTATELADWQAALELSNTEAANLLGIDRSTFLAYKAGGNISRTVAISCRAAQRDPVIMQALLRPAPPAGRKAKQSA